MFFSSLYRDLLGLLAAGLVASAPAHAQQPDSLAAQFRRYSQHSLTEELFVHLDRPAYAAGETMWMKAYAVDGTFHRPLALSKVAYVEVLDAQHRPVAQTQLALPSATGHGSLVLPATLASGRYVVRAYTSWMQNFSPDFYFENSVVIVNTFTPSGSAEGVAKAPAYDVQFFAEGGQLVQGLPGRVGFKVLDAAGHSVAAKGTVADARGKTVATFETLKFGIGSFAFIPAEAGAGYVATVQVTGGGLLKSALPAVQAQGYALHLHETSPTALVLTVQASGTGVADGGVVQLLGHAGQRIAVVLSGRLQGGRASFALNRQALPAGITHFTVFDNRRQPVAERLYFQPPQHPLTLAVRASQPSYGPRSRVELQVSADHPANLSLAVYQLDSLSTNQPADISAYLLLAADLKGTLEHPGYYLRDTSATGRAAADNLMLTQGWSRFRWRDVLAGAYPPLPHLAEANGPLMHARITTAAGTPASGVGTYLTLPNRAGRFYYARTQADGVALFEPIGLAGMQKAVLQTDPKDGGPYELSLLSQYSTQFAALRLPAWAPTPAFLPTLTERHLQVQVAQAFTDAVPYRVPALDSASVYGRVSEQYRLDDYTRFKVMEEVMREYVPGVLVRKRKDGFHFINLNRTRQLIFENDPLVLLDGVPIFRTNDIMAFDPLKVRQLNVVTSRYFQGSQVYDGVVSYATYQGDLGGFALDPHALLEEYEGVQGEREFYAPRYQVPAQQKSRLADLRNLLYWQPELSLSPGQPRTLTFYTSDQIGRYLIVAQGLAADGSTGSTSVVLEVKPAL
ncbi:MAG: hypothetical protein ACRYG7_36295 [Janthinobacterium lividum]